MKRGIIQSRGLGDIVIALPIAHYYHSQGDEIYWPICEEFLPSFKDTVPWVNWMPMKTDPQGLFFLQEPLRLFKENGIDEEEALYLYQYLNSSPELTDPELFSILKFDQYKYWVAGVPFINKWHLAECVTRNKKREYEFKKSLKLKKPYAVVHLRGSDFHANIDLSWLENDQIINIDDHKTDSIWDWLGVLEEADAFVGVDSVFANMVDSLQIPIPNLYWLRRSPWDLTPVLGSSWTIVPTTLPLAEPQRVNIVEETKAKIQAVQAHQQKSQPQNNSGLVSHAPFQAQGAIPTNFMHALKPSPNGTGNLQGGGGQFKPFGQDFKFMS